MRTTAGDPAGTAAHPHLRAARLPSAIRESCIGRAHLARRQRRALQRSRTGSTRCRTRCRSVAAADVQRVISTYSEDQQSCRRAHAAQRRAGRGSANHHPLTENDHDASSSYGDSGVDDGVARAGAGFAARAAANRLQGRSVEEQGARLQRDPHGQVPAASREPAEERDGADAARRAPLAHHPGADRRAGVVIERSRGRAAQRCDDPADAPRDQDARCEDDRRNAGHARRVDQLRDRRSLCHGDVHDADREPRYGHGPDGGHAVQSDVPAGRARQVEEPADEPTAADPRTARVPGDGAFRAGDVPGRSAVVRVAERTGASADHPREAGRTVQPGVPAAGRTCDGARRHHRGARSHRSSKN